MQSIIEDTITWTPDSAPQNSCTIFWSLTTKHNWSNEVSKSTLFYKYRYRMWTFLGDWGLCHKFCNSQIRNDPWLNDDCWWMREWPSEGDFCVSLLITDQHLVSFSYLSPHHTQLCALASLSTKFRTVSILSAFEASCCKHLNYPYFPFSGKSLLQDQWGGREENL